MVRRKGAQSPWNAFGARVAKRRHEHRHEVLRAVLKPFTAKYAGFNVHAGVTVAAHDREGRERLCRYTARLPVCLSRVSVLPDGRVAYKVKYPRRAAATHRVMTPREFMARLAALVPPRHPLTRYHGFFAPHSASRLSPNQSDNV